MCHKFVCLCFSFTYIPLASRFPPSLSPSTDGVDYSAPPTDLVFPPSSESRQTQCVELRLIDDTILEDVETFQLQLSTSASRVNITQSSATVSLVDNDRVYVSLERNEYTTTEDGEGVVEVCVELVGVTATEVEVQLSTVAGTAQGECAVLDF